MSPTDAATNPSDNALLQGELEHFPTPERHLLDRHLLDRALSDLVQRGYLEEKASHTYVVEFLANSLAKGVDPLPPKPKPNVEEIKAIVQSVQKAFREANPTGRDILAEFLTERREEAARE